MTKKVLVVEDTKDIREALKMLIEFQGYEVIVAHDGLEASKQTLQHIPDLVLMDLAMPRFDGIYATRQIRAHPETLAIPIICVTSHAREYEEEALAAGCNEVYTKTSFMDNFDHILTKYLEG